MSCLVISVRGQDFISGTVVWPDGTPYDYPGNVHVVLKNPTTGTVMSAFDFPIKAGTYAPDALFHFINPLLTFDVEVSVISDVDARAGVSVLDLVKIVKHLLGIMPFTNMLQLYAADVNNSQSVSALDLIEIRKLILGLNTEWPAKNAMTFFERTGVDPPPIVTQLNTVVTYQIGGSAGSDVRVVNF